MQTLMIVKHLLELSEKLHAHFIYRTTGKFGGSFNLVISPN